VRKAEAILARHGAAGASTADAAFGSAVSDGLGVDSYYVKDRDYTATCANKARPAAMPPTKRTAFVTMPAPAGMAGARATSSAPKRAARASKSRTSWATVITATSWRMRRPLMRALRTVSQRPVERDLGIATRLGARPHCQRRSRRPVHPTQAGHPADHDEATTSMGRPRVTGVSI
jgi:hypothetical protein